MTAEIAILNRNAAVLATDSAITSMVPSESYGHVPKISHNANKLFALSGSDPLAIMIYNDSAFGPVPWETIIKEFRRTPQGHSTVEEHAEQFIAYLQDFKQYIPEPQGTKIVIETRDRELENLRDALVEAYPTASASGGTSAEEFISRHCANRISEIERRSRLANLDLAKLRGLVEDTVSDWSMHVQNELNTAVDAQASEAVMNLVVQALRIVPLTDSYTGVVVAGFGRDQHFPALSHYVVDNVLGDDVKVVLKQNLSVQAKRYRVCRAVRPTSGAHCLPWRTSPGLSRCHTHSSMYEAIDLIYGFLLDQIGDHLTEEVTSFLHSTKNDIRDFVLQYFKNRLDRLFDIRDADDISRMVGYLSKEDIAELAEALVHLTQLKLKVSPEPETVGGPIDVAVISKGDGLIWIKRKHYFEPELNPRYFHRITQSNNEGGTNANGSGEDAIGSYGGGPGRLSCCRPIQLSTGRF